MSLEGVVQGGVVVFGSGQSLPEGTEVEIIAKRALRDEPSLARLLRFAGAVKDLPADMAINHDHYLHGAPKQ